MIDFGVAGVLQTKVDKRSTVIGTPHWMPPELHRLAPPQGLTYGTEVSNEDKDENKCASGPVSLANFTRLMCGPMAAHCMR